MTVQQQAPARGTTSAAPALLEHRGVLYRRASVTAGDHQQLAELQRRVWDAAATTPAHHLIAAETCGGVVVAALAGGRTVGFSYGFPAFREGQAWLHSHQTGVHPDWRDVGVGGVLKWLQRSLALEAGYRSITWTFDPLQSRNAYFNFVKLGVTADTYKIDYYGPLADPINHGLATDRLWVRWRLDDEAVLRRLGRLDLAPPLTASPATKPPVGLAARRLRSPLTRPRARPPAPLDLVRTSLAPGGVRVPEDVVPLRGATHARVELPADLAAVRERAGEDSATAWRLAVRAVLTGALAEGYVVTGMDVVRTGPERRCWYVLTRQDERSHPPGGPR